MTIHEIVAQERRTAQMFDFVKEHMDVAEPLAFRFSDEGATIQYDMSGFSKMVNGNIVCIDYSSADEFEFVHVSTRMNGLVVKACSLVDRVPEDVKKKYGL
jgi:hypothetical protein